MRRSRMPCRHIPAANVQHTKHLLCSRLTHGTVMPEMSLLTKRSNEPGIVALQKTYVSNLVITVRLTTYMLFRFQG